MSERLEIARWLADRRGVSFDDCDAEEQAEWQWEAEAVISKLSDYTDTDEELAMARAYITDLTAELERYKGALERISVGSALDPHMSHDPVALSECPVAYCIARQALQEQSE